MDGRLSKPRNVIRQASLVLGGSAGPKPVIPGFQPYYSTELGDAYLTDSLALLRVLPEGSINAVITSPPYALHFKKEYGNASKERYVEWFMAFGREIFRVLREDGSFILNIGGSYNPGVPTRSLYHFKLLMELVESAGFYLAQECFGSIRPRCLCRPSG